MKRRNLTSLGETEMEVLQLVWELGDASVADVQQRILERRKVAYTTVMTVMKNLADKGYLTYRRDGNSYIYTAARPAEEVRHSLLSGLIKKVFEGSPEALVQTLVKHERLTEEQQREIRRIIDSMEETDADD